MKNIFLHLFIVATCYANAQNQDIHNLYRVVRGDTFLSIAKQFSMSVKELKQLNAYDNNAKLLIGVSLFVKTSNKKYHIVQKKETLYSISKKYGLTVDELKRKNRLKNNTIEIGRYLLVK